MMIKWVAMALLAGAALPAAAQQVTAKDPQSLVRALQEKGYSAKLGTDEDGDPFISSAVGGSRFVLFFYNCTDGKDCATVQFNTGYTIEKKVSLESINEWNKTKRFGRAYIDADGDPVLSMDVDLDDGGMSQALFLDNLEFWVTVMDGYERHIGFRD